MHSAGAEVIKLPVEEENVAGLRDENALPGQLLLHTDGAEIRANAHRAGGVESNEGVPRPVPDGHNLRLNKGSVNGEWKIALDHHVNRVGINGNRQRTSGLEDRQMRWTADADLAAFHKVDARAARFDAHVTATPQHGFHLSLYSLGSHCP